MILYFHATISKSLYVGQKTRTNVCIRIKFTLSLNASTNQRSEKLAPIIRKKNLNNIEYI